MKLSIQRAVFMKALSHGQSVVEKKSTSPILGHVLLTAGSNGLTITSTDSDLALIENVPAVIEEGGSTTVSASMIYDIVRKLPESADIQLSLPAGATQLEMKAGRSKFCLSCLPAEDFPQIAQDEMPHRFVLSVVVLRKLIDRTRFAMSSEDTRYFLNGIFFHTTDVAGTCVMRAVATDAHRLAYMEIPAPQGTEGMPGVIVGRKTVTEIRKLMDESDKEVTISLSDKRIEFALENAVLSSRLIDGSYPDYERAIPVGNDKTVIVAAKPFAEAVDRIATVATDKIRAIMMQVQPNTMILSAANQDVGSGTEELMVDYESGDGVDIGFNARYLLDIAQQIDEDEAKVLLSDGNAPAIIQGMTNTEATFVIMPMRV